nr:ATP-binding cassette domain-containing protein [Desulfovibrio sp.]
VMEDLIFGPLNLGFSPEVAKLKAEETMSALGISGFGDRISWKMSGGEKKLAAIASILVMRPRILLLDEPLNELDGKAAKRIRDTVANLECAQIIISHDADFLKDIGATIVELKDGILVRE